MNRPSLQVCNLSKAISQNAAIKNINLEFQSGKKVALLGLNGAGKSTLIRLLVGETQPDGGELIYCDSNGNKFAPHELAFKSKVGYQADTMLAIEEMTGFEYLRLCGTLKRRNPDSFVQEFTQLVDDWQINDILSQKMTALSKGNLQKLAIAQAFIGDPLWIFFDEPCQSLDPIEQDRFNQNIKELSEKKLCLFSTHNVHHALEVADEIIVYHQAQVAHHFSLSRLGEYLLVLSKNNQELITALKNLLPSINSNFANIFSLNISGGESLALVTKLIEQHSNSVEFFLPEREAVMPLFRILASDELKLEKLGELIEGGRQQ